MQQQLILHIGPHKTGSTSIQEFLRMNRKQISDMGIDFMRDHSLREVWLSDNPADFLTCWRPVLDTMAASSKSLLLTDETLGEIFSKTPSAVRILKEHFPDITIKIIVYLRRQDQHYESFYNTLVRDYGHTTPPDINDILDSTDNTYIADYESRYHQEPIILQNYDYHSWLESLANEIGQENLVVRRFEKGKFINGDLYRDFVDALGLQWSETFQTPQRDINIGLNSSILDLCRRTNRCFENNMEQRLCSSFLIFICEAMNIKPPKGFFEHGDREKILDKFSQGNTLVAKKFFNSDSLFSPLENGSVSNEKKKIELEKEELEKMVLLMHHFWYEYLCNLDISLLNFVRLERAKWDRRRGVKGAKLRHYVHKTIHSIGKRVSKNWRTSTGEMKMLLEEAYLFVDIDELKKKTL